LAKPDPAVQLARVPQRIPRVDYAIAAGLLVWALLEAIFIDGPGTLGERLVLAAAFSIPLVFRRRWPAPALAVIAAAAIVRGFLGEIPSEGAMPFPALLVATFSAALYAQPPAVAVGCAALPLLAIVFGYPDSGTVIDYAVVGFICVGAWTGGWLVRRRARQVHRAYAESGELAREAVAAERTRIARELHDVVAHSVSIIAVQAGAAEELLRSDPEAAREHLGVVRRTARETITEMRRLLGVLREDEATYVPQPGLRQLDALVDSLRRSGMAIELHEEGRRPELSSGLDLNAYRIVQEALTNARKHGGDGGARLHIRYRGTEIEVEVVNALGDRAARSKRNGHGLIGMRERARVFGGNLEAGDSDGEFRVRAVLPVEEPGT
jgi:signal transduction histidine kinase